MIHEAGSKFCRQLRPSRLAKKAGTNPMNDTLSFGVMARSIHGQFWAVDTF